LISRSNGNRSWSFITVICPSAEAVRDVLANSGAFFDRGFPVRLVSPAEGGLPIAVPLTKNNVVCEVHRYCQPIKFTSGGERVDVTLSDRVANMYLDMRGEWHLPPLAGVSTAPLLYDDGTVRLAEGYDPGLQLWCQGIPSLRIPVRPSCQDAELAFNLIRKAFFTFPFSDSPRCYDASLGIEVVNLAQPPGQDESAFILSLLTAVCRPSLWLAPGTLIVAPAISGAGTGKGLLVRAISIIAFGVHSRAFTMGDRVGELDKRIGAELIEAHPIFFLDNANGIALRSDTLASLLTERPARIRVLGETRMVLLNSAAFVAVTGNGLTVTEDLARRFISCELNAHCEDPENRDFPPRFLDVIERQRSELLAAVLTIWRWGRQNSAELTRGKPLGSFEVWGAWCRDPLVTLGCRDPVERIHLLKVKDPGRQRIYELFRTWREHHGGLPVTANELAEAVKDVADPQHRGRQYLATSLSRLVGTHADGFVLTSQPPAGKWTPTTYALVEAGSDDATRHRSHRTHRTHRAVGSVGAASGAPMGPMTPMPDATDDDGVPAGGEAEI
jgi:hypothetical protein